MADALSHPCQITVHCDLCTAEVRGDYLVHASDSKETRYGYARGYLRTQGWRCDDTGDYCPDHAETPEPCAYCPNHEHVPTQPSTEDA